MDKKKVVKKKNTTVEMGNHRKYKMKAVEANPFWMDVETFNPELMYAKLADDRLPLSDVVLLMRRTLLYLLYKEKGEKNVSNV